MVALVGQEVVAAKGAFMNGAWRGADSADGKALRPPDFGPEVSGKEVAAQGFPTVGGWGWPGCTRLC